MKHVLKYALAALSVATFSGCMFEGAQPKVEVPVSAFCESQIDQALTGALHSRIGYFLTHESRMRAMAADNGTALGKPVLQLSRLHEEEAFRGSFVMWNPLRGSMALAAQSAWQKGAMTIPFRPNFHHPDGDATAFGWTVTGEEKADVRTCRYAVNFGVNPAARSLAGVPTAVADIHNGMRNVVVMAEFAKSGELKGAIFHTSSKLIDAQIVRVLSPAREDEVNTRMNNSIVVGSNVMRLLQGSLIRQDAVLEETGGRKVHTFWFEYDSKLDKQPPLYDWGILSNQAVLQKQKEAEAQRERDAAISKECTDNMVSKYGAGSQFSAECKRVLKIGPQ